MKIDPVAKSLASFKAVYCSGFFVPDPALVTAMALLFEKVYLPNNIEFIKAFSTQYRIVPGTNKNIMTYSLTITEAESGKKADPFEDLTNDQRETVMLYFTYGIKFILGNAQLFPKIFETQLFLEGEPIEVTLVKKGKPGELNTYRVQPRPLLITDEDEETFPRLFSEGYVPIVGHRLPESEIQKTIDKQSAKQLAALLGMKSIMLLFPETKATNPEDILEARDRLSDHLPPFWSSMLKLSVDLKGRIKECKNHKQVYEEAQDIIEATVRPALIDLSNKMLKERRNFFYKILAPVQRGLCVLIGNPPVTQQQLLTNALMLGSDVVMSVASNMKTIEALKGDAGLTYLLEFGRILRKKRSNQTK